ncbi:hypothetical protein HDU76_003428 [Blyttiomyces sp. JEL0837]|nr:hypothetical protein HDU76_003428 [Blyttiomyces sp. JEL0837]
MEYSGGRFRRVVLTYSQQFAVTHLKGAWERKVTLPEEWYRQVKTVDFDNELFGARLSQEEREATICLISLLENVEDSAWATSDVDEEMAMQFTIHCIQLRHLRFGWDIKEWCVGELGHVLKVLITATTLRWLKRVQVDVYDYANNGFCGRDLSQAYSLAASRSIFA